MLKMSNAKERIFQGGAFLTEDLTADDVITQEDFTEEHKMIAKTTEDFVMKEVLPKLENLDRHAFGCSVALLTKARAICLLGADVSAAYGRLALDRITSSSISEKSSRAAGFSVTHGAHDGIGSFPMLFFADDEQKEK